MPVWTYRLNLNVKVQHQKTRILNIYSFCYNDTTKGSHSLAHCFHSQIFSLIIVYISIRHFRSLLALCLSVLQYLAAKISIVRSIFVTFPLSHFYYLKIRNQLVVFEIAVFIAWSPLSQRWVFVRQPIRR